MHSSISLCCFDGTFREANLFTTPLRAISLPQLKIFLFSETEIFNTRSCYDPKPIVMPFRSLLTIVLLLSGGALSQSVYSICDLGSVDCIRPRDDAASSDSLDAPIEAGNTSPNIPEAPGFKAPPSTTIFNDSGNSAASEAKPETFHWKRALEESGTFLVIEQAWVVHTDFRWVVSENGVPFNHYWRDYKQSLSRWWQAGWSAGENPMYNYVGHPIQGAITGYIQIQNDPKSRNLEFGKTKEYWWSRVKATLWNGVYSTQWSIGPLSEMTVEKYGSNDRQPWNANGTFPCSTKTCYWGVGKVNLVMTPVGGLGWELAEDWMDRNIVRRVERSSNNRLLIDTTRCTFNPIRGAANILHGNRPWFRFRDGGDWSPPGKN